MLLEPAAAAALAGDPRYGVSLVGVSRVGVPPFLGVSFEGVFLVSSAVEPEAALAEASFEDWVFWGVAGDWLWLAWVVGVGAVGCRECVGGMESSVATFWDRIGGGESGWGYCGGVVIV